MDSVTLQVLFAVRYPSDCVFMLTYTYQNWQNTVLGILPFKFINAKNHRNYTTYLPLWTIS